MSGTVLTKAQQYPVICGLVDFVETRRVCVADHGEGR
jgi:hypothetical protein